MSVPLGYDQVAHSILSSFLRVCKQLISDRYYAKPLSLGVAAFAFGIASLGSAAQAETSLEAPIRSTQAYSQPADTSLNKQPPPPAPPNCGDIINVVKIQAAPLLAKVWFRVNAIDLWSIFPSKVEYGLMFVYLHKADGGTDEYGGYNASHYAGAQSAEIEAYYPVDSPDKPSLTVRITNSANSVTYCEGNYAVPVP